MQTVHKMTKPTFVNPTTSMTTFVNDKEIEGCFLSIYTYGLVVEYFSQASRWMSLKEYYEKLSRVEKLRLRYSLNSKGLTVLKTSNFKVPYVVFNFKTNELILVTHKMETLIKYWKGFDVRSELDRISIDELKTFIR